MAPARRSANFLAAVLAAAAASVLNWRSATANVPDTPVHPAGAWTTARRPREQEKASSIDFSHQQLEEEASRETRETFGEDFCQQLEDEQQAVWRANEARARISREAGCSPASPLSSPSLGGVEVSGDGDEAAREGAAADGFAGPTIRDWLR
eukprot:g16549.t1